AGVGHPGSGPPLAGGAAAVVFDHLQIWSACTPPRPGASLVLCSPAEMIQMPMAQNDVFDRLRIDTDFPDVTDDPVDVGFLSCVEQDIAFRSRQQPHRDIAGSNV